MKMILDRVIIDFCSYFFQEVFIIAYQNPIHVFLNEFGTDFMKNLNNVYYLYLGIYQLFAIEAWHDYRLVRVEARIRENFPGYFSEKSSILTTIFLELNVTKMFLV